MYITANVVKALSGGVHPRLNLLYHHCAISLFRSLPKTVEPQTVQYFISFLMAGLCLRTGRVRSLFPLDVLLLQQIDLVAS